MAITGPVISCMARMVASRGSSPRAIQRSMFSKTTIASSTTMPMAKTSPKSVNVFKVKPRADMTAKVPISDTGTSIMGLMMLGAAMGDAITISATGDGAEHTVAALAELVEAKFGED